MAFRMAGVPGRCGKSFDKSIQIVFLPFADVPAEFDRERFDIRCIRVVFVFIDQAVKRHAAGLDAVERFSIPVQILPQFGELAELVEICAVRERSGYFRRSFELRQDIFFL